MANVQTRKSISVSRSMYDQVKAYSDARGVPMSQVCEEAMRMLMAIAVSVKFPPAGSVFKATEQVELATIDPREYETPWPQPTLKLEYPEHPSRKIQISHGGGYDPRLGPDHPNNQDSTLPPKGKL